MSKNKLKHVCFYDEMYGKNFLFLIGGRKRSKKFVKKKYDIVIEFNYREGGKTFDVTGFGIIIWLPFFNRSAKIFGVLAHEIYHSAMYSLDGKGFEINANNAEPIAYYVEFLTTKFLQLYYEK